MAPGAGPSFWNTNSRLRFVELASLSLRLIRPGAGSLLPDMVRVSAGPLELPPTIPRSCIPVVVGGRKKGPVPPTLPLRERALAARHTGDNQAPAAMLHLS